MFSQHPFTLFTLPNLNYFETHVQFVNGLLCFHPKSKIWFSSHVSAFTLIANPTIRQVVTLPIDTTIDEVHSLSTYFGYDPIQDEFKVLRLVQYDGSHGLKVFTLGSDTSWRVVTLEKPFPLMHCLLSYPNRRCLCVNGVIYCTSSSNFLTIFDVGSGQLRVMPTPLKYVYLETDIWRMQYLDLVEIDGCLCLVGYSCNNLKLWILRDYQAQLWEQKIVVIASEVVSPQRVVFPICRDPTGEILLVPYFLLRHVKGVYYNMDTMNCRNVMLMEMPQPLWLDKMTGDIDYYQETFRLLN